MYARVGMSCTSPRESYGVVNKAEWPTLCTKLNGAAVTETGFFFSSRSQYTCSCHGVTLGHDEKIAVSVRQLSQGRLPDFLWNGTLCSEGKWLSQGLGKRANQAGIKATDCKFFMHTVRFRFRFRCNVIWKWTKKCCFTVRGESSWTRSRKRAQNEMSWSQKLCEEQTVVYPQVYWAKYQA